jgi:flagellar hook-length control protein FliK
METSRTPEPSNIQRGDDHFSGIFEKEKQKIMLPLMIPANLFSFINSSVQFSFNNDKNVAEIDRSPLLNNEYRNNSIKVEHLEKGIKSDKSDQDNASKAVEPSKSHQAEQIKFTNSAINKFFAGEMEITPEVYGQFVTAKSKLSSMTSINLDDLIAQIKDKLKLVKENGKTELSIALNPEDLGNVLMNISSKNGIISISIFADKAAKQALDENIQELERSLKNANLNVENLDIFPDDKRRQGNRREYLTDLLYNS